MPSLFRFLLVFWACSAGSAMSALFCAGQFRRSAAARDDRDHPARQVRSNRPLTMAHRPKAARTQRNADRAVPRHAGGRARRRRQHARRLPPRPRRFRRASARTPAEHIADADDRRPARLSRPPRRARLQGRVGGAAAVGGPPALSFSLRRRQARRRSGRGARRAQARPQRCPRCCRIAEVDELLAQARDACRGPEAAAGAAAARGAAALPAGSLYATGLRVSELVALPASAARRDQRMLVVRGKGGKERLVPLNQAAKRAMSDYLALRGEAGRDATSKWLFPSFGESGHLTRQHFARELEGARRRPAASSGAGSARTCCATPSPATCCTTAPTCAWCRPARPRRHLDHADLHPRAGRAAQEPGARPASAGRWPGLSRCTRGMNPLA